MMGSAKLRWRGSPFLLLFCLSAPLLLDSCASKPRLSDAPEYRRISKKDVKDDFYVGKTWIGVASYYGKEHHGKRTASGAVFDMNKLSSAHRYIPFGAKIRVFNLKNRKSVELVVNDRGPWVDGRILDVSLAAAKELDMVRDGLVEVQITILTLPNE